MKTQQQDAAVRENDAQSGPIERHLTEALDAVVGEPGAGGDDHYLPARRVRELAGRVARRVWRAWWTEPLTADRAARWSGMARDTIYEMVRSGRLPDPRPPGSQGRVLVRRCDLPRRPALDPGRPTMEGLPDEGAPASEEDPEDGGGGLLAERMRRGRG